MTETLNKACIPIDGLPAIIHLIGSFEKTTFNKFVILSGYKGEQIFKLVKYFLRDFDIKNIITNPNFTPADRLLEAKNDLLKSEKILLCYCDNIISKKDIEGIYNELKQEKVLVAKRLEGNSTINEFGRFEYILDKSKNYPYSELGFLYVDSKKFLTELSAVRDLPQAIMNYSNKNFVEGKQIMDYKSIADFDRYKVLRNGRKVVFIDRDGIINRNIGKGIYIKRIDEIKLIERNLNFLREISLEFNLDFIVISNQAGIERRMLSVEELNSVNSWIAAELLCYGIPILAFYCCPHHWDSNCDCRKPKPGLIKKAIRDFDLKSTETIFIGDQQSDVDAATNYNLKGFMLSESESNQNWMFKVNSIREYLRNIHKRK